MPTTLPTVDLLGFPLCTASRAEVLDWLWHRVQDRQPAHVVTLNPEMVLLDRREGAPSPSKEGAGPSARPAGGAQGRPPSSKSSGGRQGGPPTDVLHAADLYVADGVGIVWATKRLLRIEIERYPGIDLARDLLARLAASNGSVYLLGGAPGIAEQAAANLTAALSGLRIAGTRDGFFAPGGDAEVAGQIAASEADVLLAGMGCPRQEGFIAMQRETLGVPVMIGVGGALDVFAGAKRRAPRWVQRAGMEWAWRGLSEPARLKRQMALPRFARLVLAEGKNSRTGAPPVSNATRMTGEGAGPTGEQP